MSGCYSCGGGFGGVLDLALLPFRAIGDLATSITEGSDKPQQCGILQKQTVVFGKWTCSTDWGIIAIGAVGLLLIAGKIKVK